MTCPVCSGRGVVNGVARKGITWPCMCKRGSEPMARAIMRGVLHQCAGTAAPTDPHQRYGWALSAYIAVSPVDALPGAAQRAAEMVVGLFLGRFTIHART